MIPRAFRSVLFTIIALWAAGCPAQDGSGGAAVDAEAKLLAAGVAAPNWTLKRIDGSTLSSEELKGKVVVVDFWATWCPPCRAEIPGYVEMQKELEAQGLVIVGISLDQRGPKVVQDFAAQYRINYPLVMADQDIVEAFSNLRGIDGGVEAIPTTFLIDRDGQVRHRKVGAWERERYEALIRSLL